MSCNPHLGLQVEPVAVTVGDLEIVEIGTGLV